MIVNLIDNDTNELVISKDVDPAIFAIGIEIFVGDQQYVPAAQPRLIVTDNDVSFNLRVTKVLPPSAYEPTEET